MAQALAKDTLLHSRGSLEEIAEKVGYKSASAFSQKVGCPQANSPAGPSRRAD
ncbi:hypothetical protein [Shinella sp.]